jgi:hypothetical protein
MVSCWCGTVALVRFVAADDALQLTMHSCCANCWKLHCPLESPVFSQPYSTVRCIALAFEEFYYGFYLYAAFLTSLTIVGATFQVFVGEARGRKLVVMPGFEPGQEWSVAQTA